VVDASQPLHADDRATLTLLEGRPALIAANKIDLGEATRMDEGQRVVLTSATTGEGIAALRQAILDTSGAGATEQETPLVTNLRQRQAITAALAALERANQAAAQEVPHEMLLLDLYEALSALDSLTGTTTADDILRLIFSSFCIGK